MKKDENGDGIGLFLLSLLITIAALFVFLLPIPEQTVSVEVHVIEHAYAQENEVQVETLKLKSKELVRICSCESTDNPNQDPTKHHYEPDGKTLLTGRINPSDKGMCQINLDAHGSTIEKMGLDINDWNDYVTFTNHLYTTEGNQPWRYSKN